MKFNFASILLLALTPLFTGCAAQKQIVAATNVAFEQCSQSYGADEIDHVSVDLTAYYTCRAGADLARDKVVEEFKKAKSNHYAAETLRNRITRLFNKATENLTRDEISHAFENPQYKEFLYEYVGTGCDKRTAIYSRTQNLFDICLKGADFYMKAFVYESWNEDIKTLEGIKHD